MSFPTDLEPMLATLSDRLPAGDAWAHEVKWDGVRAVVYLHPDGRVPRILGRRGTDYSARYPELTRLSEALDGCGGAVLDAEIVALDANGRPSFELMQQRMHVTDPGEVALRRNTVPVSLAVFDLLWVNGTSLITQPWSLRRDLLEKLPLKDERGRWQLPAAHRGDGTALFEATKAAGFEGLVSKRIDSVYEPGRRGKAWLKVKHKLEEEMVIGGWVPGDGGRLGRIGALLIGTYDEEGRLWCNGKVGTGFTSKVLDELLERFGPLARDTSPFAAKVDDQRVARWLEPALVCDVEFAEWTTIGTLRHPSYKGLRVDKAPEEIVRPRSVP